MSDRVPYRLLSATGGGDKGECAVKCEHPYALQGPQVEPEASCWLQAGVPRVITEDDLRAQVEAVITRALDEDDLEAWPGFSAGDPKFPTDPTYLCAEIEELVQLSRLRDELGRISNVKEFEHPPEVEPQRARLPLSAFLEFRPQPLGAIINTARDQSTFPVVANGRELGRYFENETPGLQFRHALNAIIRESGFSPPRQAFIWAALDTAIASALAAAWYYKWRGGECVQYRPRPWECYNPLDVLFDRLSNSTNSADSARRAYPPGVPFDNPRPHEVVLPEAEVPDSIMPNPDKSYRTPGTPRHPAYPSGHSTYSSAAAFTLTAFFPQYATELLRLADNTGMARLWAGVHWRSDHVFGQLVGRAVAELVVQQLIDACIFEKIDDVECDVVYLPGSLRYLRPRLFVRAPESDFSKSDAEPPTPAQVEAACHKCHPYEGESGKGDSAEKPKH